MFDFSLTELMVIMVVTLIVVGPQRLPKVARTLGHLWGRAQKYVNGVKSDIERDMAIEEFRQFKQAAQAEADAMGESFKQVELTADQQAQQIKEAVAKLSIPDQATQPPKQPEAKLPPAQPEVNPAPAPPADKQ